MNTVLKGNWFENECYILIRRMLETFKLPLLPAICSVYQKKGYYSKDREGDIIFDLSIEAWPEGATNYALLYLIECKNYEKKVPVDDVEEFHAKVQQVAGLNVKGVFIAKNAFQEGAYKFARSKGIMLITGDSNLTMSIILHKANRHRQEQTEKEFPNLERKEFDDPFYQTYVVRKWRRVVEKQILSAFVFNMKAQPLPKGAVIPTLSKKEIDEFTIELLDAYDPEVIRFAKSLNLESFKAYLEEVFDLQVIHSSSLGTDLSGRKIVSHCSFLTKVIEIDRSVVGTNRYSFILAHELGHFFLHNKLQLDQTTYEGFEDSIYSFSIDKHQIVNERGWIEWQANKFASCLIMPAESMLKRLFLEQDQINLRQGRPLYVDSQKCNQDDFHTIVGNLAAFFGTTKTTVIYRLETLKMLTFDPNYKGMSVGQIIAEMYPDLFR